MLGNQRRRKKKGEREAGCENGRGCKLACRNERKMMKDGRKRKRDHDEKKKVGERKSMQDEYGEKEREKGEGMEGGKRRLKKER